MSINGHNKHIDITFQYVRDVATQIEMRLQPKSTIQMRSNILTKPLIRITSQRRIGLAGTEIIEYNETNDLLEYSNQLGGAQASQTCARNEC